MKVLSIVPDARAVFVERSNRFLAFVKLDGKKVAVHVHDPGRLEELLYPGASVLIKRENNKNRKTKWDLIASNYHGQWVLVNSKYHRYIAEKLLRMLLPEHAIKPEVKIGASRIDFLAEEGERIAIEVKGCTLSREGIALFPDAPTKRGLRHVEELMKFAEHDRAMLLILIFRADAKCFAPNEDTDPEFAKTFWNAIKAGVDIYPALLSYDGNSIYYLRKIPVCNLNP